MTAVISGLAECPLVGLVTRADVGSTSNASSATTARFCRNASMMVASSSLASSTGHEEGRVATHAGSVCAISGEQGRPVRAATEPSGLKVEHFAFVEGPQKLRRARRRTARRTMMRSIAHSKGCARGLARCMAGGNRMGLFKGVSGYQGNVQRLLGMHWAARWGSSDQGRQDLLVQR
ncbi:hypothetical protein GOP47_0017081 [Adiantum capillus-veneris]|uniref:Uncharacterized protein n=1 Tax=Adiantum capillus-veneris TaxID=13818 RepID=A0A9D4UIX2_ADICA|nr:hypothetical protein GOP47_0017081 [Adiantum capillus-veneris]